jgi:FkbM family methyltransferase
MRGPRRRRVYELLNTAAKRVLGHRVRSGPARGARFSGGDTAGYVLGVSEPAVQAAIVQHLGKGGVLYDVGAHAGFMTVLGCHLGGYVHSFEPIPENLAALRRNLEANGFTNASIHEIALSDEDGTACMDPGEHAITAGFAADGGVPVRTARCDSLGLPAPTVVKIDVEGAETAVLRGMTQTLRHHRPVVIVEIHDGQEPETRRILAEHGYGIAKIDDGGMPHLLATPCG